MGEPSRLHLERPGGSGRRGPKCMLESVRALGPISRRVRFFDLAVPNRSQSVPDVHALETACAFLTPRCGNSGIPEWKHRPSFLEARSGGGGWKTAGR